MAWVGASREVVRRRVSSNEGIFRTGDTGTVGFKIDFKGNDAVDCNTVSEVVAQRVNDTSVRLTFRRLPLECCRASSPPGPRLLLRDFFSFELALAFVPDDVAMSVVAFSLSRVDVILDRGT